MTAGHNALRGSGPGHKPAFDNAAAKANPDSFFAPSPLGIGSHPRPWNWKAAAPVAETAQGPVTERLPTFHGGGPVVGVVAALLVAALLTLMRPRLYPQIPRTNSKKSP
jgi:hypothetical protein